MDKTLGNIGEFGLIDLISRQFKVPEGVTGIGDDCAVIPQREGFDTLVSTDMLVEGSHFIRDRISPEDLLEVRRSQPERHRGHGRPS